MKIADSARTAIQTALRTLEPGTLPVLLLGYIYDQDWQRIPRVEINVYYSPDTMDRLAAEYGEPRNACLRDYDGITFYMVLQDDDGLLDGRLLVFDEGVFALKLQ